MKKEAIKVTSAELIAELSRQSGKFVFGYRDKKTGELTVYVYHTVELFGITDNICTSFKVVVVDMKEEEGE